MPENAFANTLSQVQAAPPEQRAEQLITSIAKQMQQSTSAQTQQWGSELSSLKTQLAKACQSN
jgi:hypothetical protein